MAASPHLVFAGSATLDMIFSVDALPVGAGKILPRRLVQAAHGMATSAAIAAARLGGRATLIARIGDDQNGDRFLADVEAEGVDCRQVRRFAGVPTPLSAVIVDKEGERLVVPYYDHGLGADPSWIPDALITSADAVQVDIRWPEAAARLLALARDAGKIGVLDGDIGPLEVLNELAGLASHSVFSEPAAKQLSGQDDVAAALMVLGRRFPGFVAITAGAEGCYWFDKGEVCHARPPSVVAVDTLAAGDVFHGAFTLALAEKRSIEDAVHFANAAAALKCTIFGGRLGSPDREAVEALLAR